MSGLPREPDFRPEFLLKVSTEIPRQMIPLRASAEIRLQSNFGRQVWTLWQAAVTATTLLHSPRWILRGSITPWQAVVTAITLLHSLRWILRSSITPWQAAVTATILLYFLQWILCSSTIP